jgi:serine/threonine protein kinase
MGVVYRARQLSLNRIVALKMIRDPAHASSTERVRFQVEAEMVARLRHANIVAIHEVGTHDGQPFFALEYVEGETARALSRAVRPRVRAAYGRWGTFTMVMVPF